MKTINEHKGFTLIELLIAMAILGIILAGLASLFASQNRHHAAQNEILQMQGNARAAMDFVTRTMRGISSIPDTIPGSPAIPNPHIVSAGCNSSITFFAVEDFGMASGGGNITLNDTRKSWTANEWQNFNVTIVSGTGARQTRTIVSNAQDTLTVNTAWNPVPDATSEYRILSFNRFSRRTTDNNLTYARNASGDTSLAENITCFTVQGVGSPITSIDITISAETPRPLPDRGARGTITLDSSIDVRN
jgi:prepilin-type N-terminal cleavage/methylation domain-containing protein